MFKILANVVGLMVIAPFCAAWEWFNADTTSPRARGMKNMPSRIRAINRRAH
jgi:hypothetical protein